MGKHHCREQHHHHHSKIEIHVQGNKTIISAPLRLGHRQHEDARWIAAQLDGLISASEVQAVMQSCKEVGLKKWAGCKVMKMALLGGGIAMVAAGIAGGWALIGIAVIGFNGKHVDKKAVEAHLKGVNERMADCGLAWHLGEGGVLELAVVTQPPEEVVVDQGTLPVYEEPVLLDVPPPPSYQESVFSPMA